MRRREILQALAATLAGMNLADLAEATGRSTATRSAQTSGTGKRAAGEAQPVNLLEFEALAKRRITRMAYDYIAGGAADEITLRRNREGFDKILLLPRVLVDVSKLDTTVELLGRNLAFPILLAPTAYHKLVNPEGERATVQGAGKAGATMVVSSFATVAVEDVAKAATEPLWFQLYVQRDRVFTLELMQRAEAAGCKALCITVDTPVAGTRDREARHQFHLPPGLEVENLRKLVKSSERFSHMSEQGIYSLILDPTLTWKEIDWIRDRATVPVLLKGILSPEDARLAVEHGVAGVIVSNHGGRNLDTVPATIEALPKVAEAVAGRASVLMDGGVRRGTDVIKALALGAQAVLIGRPYLWGLAVGGAEGVKQVLAMLRRELEAAMALCGTSSLSRITRSVIWE